MMCFVHNRWTPLTKCEQCEREEKELEYAAMIAEMENKQPIVLWEGRMSTQ